MKQEATSVDQEALDILHSFHQPIAPAIMTVYNSVIRPAENKEHLPAGRGSGTSNTAGIDPVCVSLRSRNEELGFLSGATHWGYLSTQIYLGELNHHHKVHKPKKTINCGVPQGAISAPLNFFINACIFVQYISVCSPLTCCSGTLECPVTSVTPVTPETVTLWPEMVAMVTLLRWMYLRKTSAFRLARVQACDHGRTPPQTSSEDDVTLK